MVGSLLTNWRNSGPVSGWWIYNKAAHNPEPATQISLPSSKSWNTSALSGLRIGAWIQRIYQRPKTSGAAS